MSDDETCKSAMAGCSLEMKYANLLGITKNHNLCAMPPVSFPWEFFPEFRKGKAIRETVIDPDNQAFKRFAGIYFDEYGNQSVEHFSETFQLTDNEKTITLQPDADYSVIGKFLPVERELTWLGYLTYYSTVIPYILTLGMIPSVEHNKIRPSYYISDKKFNQVASYHYRSEYWLVSTIWALDPKYPVKPDMAGSSK